MVAETFLAGGRSLSEHQFGHGYSLLPGHSGPDHLLAQGPYKGREVGKNPA